MVLPSNCIVCLIQTMILLDVSRFGCSAASATACAMSASNDERATWCAGLRLPWLNEVIERVVNILWLLGLPLWRLLSLLCLKLRFGSLWDRLKVPKTCEIIVWNGSGFRQAGEAEAFEDGGHARGVFGGLT